MFLRKLQWLLALAAAMALTTPVSAGEASGTATVVDGETLILGGKAFRLTGIDAPEAGQECWLTSKLFDCYEVSGAALTDLVMGAQVTCKPLEDFGAAPLARCFADGYDLSEGMTYTGLGPGRPGKRQTLPQVRKGRRRGQARPLARRIHRTLELARRPKAPTGSRSGVKQRISPQKPPRGQVCKIYL